MSGGVEDTFNKHKENRDMKFEEGARVKVIGSLSEGFLSGTLVTEDMARLAGKYVTIAKPDDRCREFGRCKVEGSLWYWTEEMLEPMPGRRTKIVSRILKSKEVYENLTLYRDGDQKELYAKVINKVKNGLALDMTATVELFENGEKTARCYIYPKV